MRWDRLVLLGALAGLAPCAAAQLCSAGEAVVFSCKVGAKTVSLCRPAGVRAQLSYRFGTGERLDMVYPAAFGLATQPRFELATTPLFGGGITTVSFRRGAWRYQVYSKSGRADDAERTPFTEDGVIVTRGGKTAWHLVCDDGGAGFREELGWLPRAAGQ
jgi:hypothetical protein